jgi:hypothetical protein
VLVPAEESGGNGLVMIRIVDDTVLQSAGVLNSSAGKPACVTALMARWHVTAQELRTKLPS